MNDFLQIAFSTNCISKAKESGVTIDELVMTLTRGIIRRLQDGHLSFLYKGVEVITCDSAIVALDLNIHKPKKASGATKLHIHMSDYELAMSA